MLDSAIKLLEKIKKTKVNDDMLPSIHDKLEAALFINPLALHDSLSIPS